MKTVVNWFRDLRWWWILRNRPQYLPCDVQLVAKCGDQAHVIRFRRGDYSGLREALVKAVTVDRTMCARCAMRELRGVLDIDATVEMNGLARSLDSFGFEIPEDFAAKGE